MKLFILTLLITAQTLAGFSQETKALSKIENNTQLVTITDWLVAGTFPSDVLPSDGNHESAREGYSVDFLKEIGGETNVKIGEGTTVGLPNGKQTQFKYKKWNEEYIDLIDIDKS